MESKLAKTILFASVIWLTRVILPQNAQAADIVVCPSIIGSQTLEDVGSQYSRSLQISPPVVAFPDLACMVALFMGSMGPVVASFRSIHLPASPLSRLISSSKTTMASDRSTALALLPLVCLS